MDGSSMLFLGVLMIAIGLLIIVYGVRIARIYALLSALGLAVSLGFALATFLAMVLRMAGSLLIPVLIALAAAGGLLYWVAKAYMTYLKIYAVLGIVKFGLCITALSLTLFRVQGAVALVIILAVTGVAIWLIVKVSAKWGHLLYMLGIMTDGALISIAGGVITGASSGQIGATVLLAVLAVPLLIWAGLYRECWRQKIAFPGIKSW